MSRVVPLILWGNREPQGPLQLLFELSGTWSDASVTELNPIVHAFAAAGEKGAYCPSGTAPSESFLSLTGGPKSSGNVVRFELRASGIDGRCFQYLRHMAGRLDFPDSSLRRIEMRELQHMAPPRRSIPLIDHDNEVDQYPGAASSRSFVVHWPHSPPSKRRRVLLEMRRDVQRTTFDLIREVVKVWGKLVEGGAFTLPVGYPDELDCVMGPVTQFDIRTIEVEIPVLKGCEVCWESLLNTLEVLHHRGSAISSVEIE